MAFVEGAAVTRGATIASTMGPGAEGLVVVPIRIYNTQGVAVNVAVRARRPPACPKGDPLPWQMVSASTISTDSLRQNTMRELRYKIATSGEEATAAADAKAALFARAAVMMWMADQPTAENNNRNLDLYLADLDAARVAFGLKYTEPVDICCDPDPIGPEVDCVRICLHK